MRRNKGTDQMNRWMRLAVVVMAVGMPALAQGIREGEWQQERGRRRDFRDEMVALEKQRMQWMLGRMEGRISELIARSKGDRRMAQALKDLREDLNDIRDTVNSAEELRGRRWRDRDDRDYRDDRDHRVPPLPQPPQQVPPPPPVYYPPSQPPPPPGQGMGRPASPLSDRDFRILMGALARESFANDKLRVLEQSASTSYFLVAHVQQILADFSFPADRLKAVRILRPRIVDTNNFVQLYGSFEFPRDKEELRRILGP